MKTVPRPAKDEKEDWEAIEESTIDFDCLLPHMDPEAVRYYLPAYMTWTLRNPGSSSPTTCGTAWYFNHKRVKNELVLLNSKQLEATRLFLLWCAEQGDEYFYSREEVEQAIRRSLGLEP
ncbi:MAG: DUF6714 family protein [Planctomycetota bacterium]